MEYRAAVDYINSFLRFGSRPGLQRIDGLLNRLDNPQDKLRFVHVAGTNGKGSTCVYIANILADAGYKTGLFTSPFVTDFRERFQINGEMISRRSLAAVTAQVKSVVDTLHDEELPTEFELITAIAYLYFLREGCDAVVLEVGLGGLLDSTNTIKTPMCSVITSISLDHTDVLGDTIEEIARQKAGIIKENGVTVCYPKQSAAAMKVIEAAAKSRSNTLVIPEMPVIIAEGALGDAVSCYGLRFTLRVPGCAQAYNAAVAIAAAQCCRQAGLDISDCDIVSGLSRSVVPARCEMISVSPPVILDGAHNPDGIQVLCDYLRKYMPRCVGIVGMMADKDTDTALRMLAPCFERIYTVTADNPRAMSARQLCEAARKYHSSVAAANSLRQALSACNGEPLCICGSFYLSHQARKLLT